MPGTLVTCLLKKKIKWVLSETFTMCRLVVSPVTMHNALPSTPASPNRHVHLYTPIHGYACSHVNSDPGCKGYQGHVTNWASDDKTYPYHQHEHVSHVTKKKDYQKAERKTFISLFLKDLVYTSLC